MPEEMARCDELTIAAGTPGVELMERAGRGVGEYINANFERCAVLVLCGPGNNGGDGLVVARRLKEAGWPVQVVLAGRKDELHGDARVMAGRWQGATGPLPGDVPAGTGLIVDGLFGAGLSRDIGPDICALFANIERAGVPVIAIDLPSGVDGGTGQVRAAALRCAASITFFCKKPGHVLLPGRQLCGPVKVVDIGIGAGVLDKVEHRHWENLAQNWLARLAVRTGGRHKYDFGHTVVLSGGMMQTGAARLAAMGALRAGSGLVSVAAPGNALNVHAAHLTAIMLARVDDERALAQLLTDERHNAVVAGPGNGVGGATRAKVLAGLASGAACVLDADALTSFAGQAGELFAAIKAMPERPVVLTPHDGEFGRLFEARKEPGKCERALAAATASGAIVVLKGADSVIATPGGRCFINTNGPAHLATAGSGDVLAGIIGGLLAQKMSGVDAACAGVWLHGAAGTLCGRGLIAEDLPHKIPAVLQNLPA